MRALTFRIPSIYDQVRSGGLMVAVIQLASALGATAGGPIYDTSA